MARKATAAAAHTTAWLPGFEPEAYESAHLVGAQQLSTQTNANPFPQPSSVGFAPAFVAQGHEEQPAVRPSAILREALQVIGGDDEGGTEHSTPVGREVQPVEREAGTSSRRWPQFDSAKYAPVGGQAARIEQNLEALRLAKEIGAHGTSPTDEQRHELLRYVGWGGIAKVFETFEGNSLAPQQEALKSVLTDSEFSSARASTPTAYYTDPVVVQAMWTLVAQLGFKGGRIIEPAAGTGLFLAGMPAEIATASEITAVEIDKATGHVLQAVFGDLGVNVQISAIEKSGVPHGFYDLAIGNVPFAEVRARETSKVGYADWNIHNYFFGKAVDLVRPGGLIAFITSTGTLDSKTTSHRKWLDAHTEFLGAIRLPTNAFKHQAGTDVAADIVVLKKRQAPLFSASGQWIEQKKAPVEMLAPGQSLSSYNTSIRRDVEYPRDINEWFVAHPGMVIGELHFESTQYGQKAIKPKLKGGIDALPLALAQAIKGFPVDVYAARQESEQPAIESMALQRIDATSQRKPGSFVLQGEKIYISEGATWIDVDAAYSGMARQRLLGLIKIRDSARRLLELQLQSDDDSHFKGEQLRLNVLYDEFVGAYGNMADRANLRLFRSDPECPLVLSLETFNEDAERYEKAAIFTRRTAGRKPVPTSANSVKDAMLISLGAHGRINLGHMQSLLATSRKEVERGLRDERLAYLDPTDGQWKPADEYLSGHIRNKIAAAEAAGEKFRPNVEALKSVLPKDLGPGEVEVRLGAPWIPVHVVEDFAAQLISAKDIKVSYDAGSATWSVKGSSYKLEYEGNRVLNCSTWGTTSRCALELIEAVLNQVPPKITQTIDGKSIVDRSKTLAAREKYEAIKAEFKKWAYKEEARRDELLRIYNDQFNQIVERKYDGSHLVLHGMSDAITPYAHQLNAIWRIVSGGNTLLAHAVGAGKTLVMIAAAMELRRIGRASKPCVIVPNHMLFQLAAECVQAYPNAKVLMATKEDLTGDNRRQFAARVATGDWDLVMMTHASFEKLPLRPETSNRFLGNLMDQARMTMASMQEQGRDKRRTVKQVEKLVEALGSKLERLVADGRKDDFIHFDDLGIDWLLADEVHLHKNLMRISKMPSIAGLPNVSSNRAFDLWCKTSVLQEMRGGKEEGVTFATATPIANSIAEMHVMQRFLQPETLKQLGLYEFDAWAATFGEAVQGMEVAPDGSGYRLNTRFSKFVNVSDLMAIFRLVADIQTKSMLKLPRPKIKGGKPQARTAPKSAELADYTEKLVERANKVRSGAVKPEVDNMLAITNCGRKAALDMRLVMPWLQRDPHGKVMQLCKEVHRIWNETAQQRGTQVIFCDLSTPNTKEFSVYRDVREVLIEMGIPAEQIEFMQDHTTDAAKDKLFRRVRAGIVRVLLGSTMLMGVGTNVQKRLKAVHQLDAPWRPADVEQRDGRGERMGNMWDEIELLRYVSQGSFDAYNWQTLETKQGFIDQIMSPNSGLRTVEDLAMGALTYAEIKAIASGNPMVLEKATIDAEVMTLSVLQDQWHQDRWRWGRDAKVNAAEVQSIRKVMSKVEVDAQALAHDRASGWTFVPNGEQSALAKGSTAPSVQIGAQLLQACRNLPKGWCGSVVVGSVAGVQITLSRYDGLSVSVQGQGRSYVMDRAGVHIENIQRTGEKVLELMETLINEPDRLQRLADLLERENQDIQQRLQQQFEHDDRLTALIARQREIEVELDLDKSEVGAEAVAEAAQAA